MAKKKVLTLEERLDEALIPVGEHPYEIPNNWKFVKLGTVMSLKNGVAVKSSEYGNGEISLIRISNIKDNGISLDKAVKVELNDKYSKYLIEKGDLLVAMSGATTGKMGVYNSDANVLQNQRVGNIKVIKNAVNIKLRNYYFRAKQDEILRKAYGGAQPNISSKLIEEMQFPLPPLAEQERIVAKVESMLVKVKQAKELILEARETFENRRASILHKAFTGELTKEWRAESSINNDELSVNNLLEKINEEKMAKWEQECELAIAGGKKKPRKPKVTPVKEMKVPASEQPYELPQGWTWVRAEQIYLTPPRNGYSPKACEYKTSTKTLKLGAITKGIFNSEEYKYIDEIIDEESYLWLEKGDFLIQRANSIDYVGMSALYTGEDKEFIYPDLIMKAKISRYMKSNLFSLFVNSKFGREYFKSNATGTSGNMPKINQKVVNGLFIPLAPLVEQEELLRRVENLLKAEEEALELLKMEDQVELLEKSILSKAFRGELGTGDESDEPAMELLKRVLEC